MAISGALWVAAGEQFIFLVLALSSHLAIAQSALPDAAEVERRNAAATFATGREIGLALLLGACKSLMVNSEPAIETVARAWIDRNHNEMDAALFWLHKYMSALQLTDPKRHQIESRALIQAQSQSTSQLARTFFKRELPSKQSCEHVANVYSATALDFLNMASSPGLKQFAEFPQTLLRIRQDADFAVADYMKLRFDKLALQAPALLELVYLDAAAAAGERGDVLGRVAIFKSMAEGGSGQAAQTIGVMMLNGDQVPKNQVEAYGWFYTAWTLSDPEGLNAMGVMLRDGLGVEANLPVAYAAFLVSKTAARTQAAFGRAQSNAARLAPKISPEDTARIACLNVAAFDSALRRPVRSFPIVVQAKPISNPERRLGELVKELATAVPSSACNS